MMQSLISKVTAMKSILANIDIVCFQTKHRDYKVLSAYTPSSEITRYCLLPDQAQRLQGPIVNIIRPQGLQGPLVNIIRPQGLQGPLVNIIRPQGYKDH